MLGGLLLCAKVFDQRGDLIRLESIGKGRHAAAAFQDAMLDVRLGHLFADGAEVRAFLAAYAVNAMTVLAAAFMEEGSAEPLLIAICENARRRS